MTIRKSKESNCMIAQCDKCFDIVEFEDIKGFDADDWSEVKNEIDIDGWKTKKEGDKWVNICCDCQ